MLDHPHSATTELGNNVFYVLGVVISVMTGFQDLRDLTRLQLWVIYPKMSLIAHSSTHSQARERHTSNLLLTEIKSPFYRLEILLVQ